MSRASGMDRPRVFSDRQRDDPHPQRRDETTFEFYDRVSSPYWAQVRDRIQEWADRLDEEAYKDLTSRLRADDHAHRAAYLELFLHELFSRAGYQVTTHPDVPTGSRRPDLLIRQEQDAFYVEVTTPGPTPEAVARAAREQQFLATIEKARNRNFFLQLIHLEAGPEPARGSLARARLDSWLDGLDPDAPVSLATAPCFHWEDGGWVLRLSAIPVPADHRSSTHRIIAIEAHHPASFVDDAPSMKRVLEKKTSAYGELPHPLVIALGTYTCDSDRWHIQNALYGYVRYMLDPTRDYEVSQAAHDGSGYFGRPGRWRATRAAGVLDVHQLAPYRPQHARLTLHPHPGRANVLTSLAHRLPATVIEVQDEQFLEILPRLRSCDLLGVPDQWPGGEPFPRPSRRA